MIYALNDLLMKMGAPEVREKNRIEWHYFDKKRNDIAGSAEIRMEAGGARLIAELAHIRENYEDDDGRLHDIYVESFFLRAERTPDGRYKIAEIGFDGDVYAAPQAAVVELGLSVFHSRALDISIMMVEQAFNKQDILDPVMEPPRFMKDILARSSAAARAQKAGTCVIIPFPRQNNRPVAVRGR